MSQASSKTGQPVRRRFAPIPIETTFERYRKGGPTGEPTPSPSPRSPSPPRRLWTQEKPKRRFAPQLIESSRRCRRVGDVGPATKPTDKTDITPYTNHIYAPKARKKHRKVQSLARRESCDDETAEHFFETLVRENEKRILEDALAAFPNSGARAGGAEHFAIREGSDDDSSGSASRGITGPHPLRIARRSRRDSLTEDVGWALREMQEHHDQLDKVKAASIVSSNSPYIRSGNAGEPSPEDESATAKHGHADRLSTLDLDRMSIESPPSDPIWTTTGRRPSQDHAIHPAGEAMMPFIPEEPLDLPGPKDGYRGIPSYARQLREAEGDVEEDEEELIHENITRTPGPIGESLMPYIPSAPDGQAASMAYKPPLVSTAANHLPPDTEFRGRGPFAGYHNRDLFAERDLNRLRRKSPPMLGKDLVFPKCLSPQTTKLDPEYLWSLDDHRDDSHRDATGKFGLWHGFCYSREKNEALVPIDRPVMLATPYPPSTPGDPFAHAFSLTDPGTICDEPASTLLDGRNGLGKAHGLTRTPNGLWPGTMSAGSGTTALKLEQQHKQQQQHRGGNAGLHALMSLDERLREEKKAAELEEKIAAEFTDGFVTQVYNYLSLGYPAMARAYDGELSKISHIPTSDLERDDDGVMDGIGSASGHIGLDDKEATRGKKAKPLNHSDCPRWRALKIYIYEWARQHPDLNSISPLAWGMQERRGSWGV